MLSFEGYNVITELLCGICRNIGGTKVISVTENVNIIEYKCKFIYTDAELGVGHHSLPNTNS
jgi:hypothetical protein